MAWLPWAGTNISTQSLMFTIAGSDFQLVFCPLSTILNDLPNQSTVVPINLSDETPSFMRPLRSGNSCRSGIVSVCPAPACKSVEAAVAPHARHVMVRDVAVIEEFAGQVLASAATAFRFKVQCLGRADDFHIDAIGLRPDDRILDRTILTGRPEIVRFRARAPLPADGSAVRMGMEYFGSPCTNRHFTGSPKYPRAIVVGVSPNV